MKNIFKALFCLYIINMLKSDKETSALKKQIKVRKLLEKKKSQLLN